MSDFTVSTACGRSVLIRDCQGGEAVQLGIIGKRGGMVEAVSFDAAQLPGLIDGLARAGEEAERIFLAGRVDARASLLDLLADAEARANATHCEHGHELTKANSFRQGNGKGCRTCRREGNYWHKRGLL